MSYKPEGNNTDKWSDATAAFYKEGKIEKLEIKGHPVMESWEKPFMRKLAEIANSNGGCVLEIGFGLGIASNVIQQVGNLDTHIIIEANADVFKNLIVFKDKAPHKVIPIFGLWQDVIGFFKEEQFDGILYDTYPTSEEIWHTHQFDFIRQVRPLLKPNGILTYCNLTSWGYLKGNYKDDKELFDKTQLPYLKAAGYCPEKIHINSVRVDPPVNCKYYTYNTAPVPIIRK